MNTFSFWTIRSNKQYCTASRDIFERFGLNQGSMQKKAPSFDRILPKSVTVSANTDGSLCSYDIENFIKVR